MSKRIELIRQLLTQHFQPSLLEIQDDSESHSGHYDASDSEPSHLTLRISSSHFNGISKVNQHKMIYKVLDPIFKAGLHALSLDIVDS